MSLPQSCNLFKKAISYSFIMSECSTMKSKTVMVTESRVHLFIALFSGRLEEIRRRGSKDLLKVYVLTEAGETAAEEGQPVPVQIYAVPYEGSGDGDKLAVARPEQDPRPSPEYELPREWKKEHIVRTLSGTPHQLNSDQHEL